MCVFELIPQGSLVVLGRCDTTKSSFLILLKKQEAWRSVFLTAQQNPNNYLFSLRLRLFSAICAKFKFLSNRSRSHAKNVRARACVYLKYREYLPNYEYHACVCAK